MGGHLERKLTLDREIEKGATANIKASGGCRG